MKKRIKALLALLAALALIFAAGCDTNGTQNPEEGISFPEDDPTYTSDYSGNTYTYSTGYSLNVHYYGAGIYLSTLALEFAEEGNSVDVTAVYFYCTATGENITDHTDDASYEASVSGAAYTETSSGVSLFLPQSANPENSSLTLYLTHENNVLTLTGTSAEVPSYTVKSSNDSGSGIDLLAVHETMTYKTDSPHGTLRDDNGIRSEAIFTLDSEEE